MRFALALAVVAFASALPTAGAVPYCPIDGVELCSEHGSDAVRHTWLDAEHDGTRACLILHTDLTGFARNGAQTCGVESAGAAGEASACVDSVQWLDYITWNACASHDSDITGATRACNVAHPDVFLWVVLTSSGCIEHADPATGETRVCWDRWDNVYAGVVLASGVTCVEHADPITGTTRVHDDALRFTNGLLTVHEGGTSVDTPIGHVDHSLWGYSLFAAFNSWRASGNVTNVASWNASAFSDPLAQQAHAQACARVLDLSSCSP